MVTVSSDDYMIDEQADAEEIEPFVEDNILYNISIRWFDC